MYCVGGFGRKLKQDVDNETRGVAVSILVNSFLGSLPPSTDVVYKVK